MGLARIESKTRFRLALARVETGASGIDFPGYRERGVVFL